MKPLARIALVSLLLAGCGAARGPVTGDLATIAESHDASSGGASALRPMPERYVLAATDAESHAAESPGATAARATVSP